MHLVDTHAHIYLDAFKDDRDDQIEQGKEAGVTSIYMPNIDHTSIDDMLELEEQQPDYCHAMMGLHPCSVKKDFEKELYLVEDWLSKRPFIAIGEIGTDLYWDDTFYAYQREAFMQQVTWAQQYQVPVVIHCRESIAETIKILEDRDQEVSGVFHCFTGDLKQAEQIIALGCKLGIGGVATFKNGGMDQVIPKIELEHLLLETDSPYLAPVPFRGKRNSPVHLPLIAARVAELKDVTIEEVAATTTRNALDLFKMDHFTEPSSDM
ncbi:MAG: TatD family hydrolase [Cyclobacteriaceae bacterium]